MHITIMLIAAYCFYNVKQIKELFVLSANWKNRNNDKHTQKR